MGGGWCSGKVRGECVPLWRGWPGRQALGGFSSFQLQLFDCAAHLSENARAISYLAMLGSISGRVAAIRASSEVELWAMWTRRNTGCGTYANITLADAGSKHTSNPNRAAVRKLRPKAQKRCQAEALGTAVMMKSSLEPTADQCGGGRATWMTRDDERASCLRRN